MRDELPGDPLKAAWQSQPTGRHTMTMERIREKARELRAKTRRQLLGTLAGPLAAGFFYTFGIRQFPGLAHVLHPLFACALAWSLLGLFYLNRGMWAPAMPADAGLSTGLEFCRREIGRRRALLSRVLVWSLGPILMAIGTFILALVMIGNKTRGIFPNGLPFLILVVAWIVGYFVQRLRERRELEREIGDLDELERDNSR